MISEVKPNLVKGMNKYLEARIFQISRGTGIHFASLPHLRPRIERLPNSLPLRQAFRLVAQGVTESFRER